MPPFIQCSLVDQRTRKINKTALKAYFLITERLTFLIIPDYNGLCAVRVTLCGPSPFTGAIRGLSCSPTSAALVNPPDRPGEFLFNCALGGSKVGQNRDPKRKQIQKFAKAVYKKNGVKLNRNQAEHLIQTHGEANPLLNPPRCFRGRCRQKAS